MAEEVGDDPLERVAAMALLGEEGDLMLDVEERGIHIRIISALAVKRRVPILSR